MPTVPPMNLSMSVSYLNAQMREADAPRTIIVPHPQIIGREA